MRTTQTLKFVNLARLLQIIRYDPVQYMNLGKLSELRNRQKPVKEKTGDHALNASFVRQSGMERNRGANLGLNLF